MEYKGYTGTNTSSLDSLNKASDAYAQNAKDEASAKIDQQKLDIQKQELQVQQQQQSTNQLLAIGGLSISAVLVLVIVTFLIVKMFRREQKSYRKS